ncbi:hypothetical protein FA09DRAFT_113025 [Tilletiopsis washingtonensis]|uniref:Uncharacterized protein n=1 Tax=Tilletiopsis washingtonensis TaxID=58919 RepID=A0A316ZHL0_9BASI|nr:hypothetical protein FA09DRAFT_113025 [Tilletiopsis washingtonensis]PWO00757.1 hypothetical protein FA09DRAFT_113025 [Tilletiopsis washingtonensis]
MPEGGWATSHGARCAMQRRPLGCSQRACRAMGARLEAKSPAACRAVGAAAACRHRSDGAARLVLMEGHLATVRGCGAAGRLRSLRRRLEGSWDGQGMRLQGDGEAGRSQQQRAGGETDGRERAGLC